jgi:sugar lactone lactonase YvrE
MGKTFSQRASLISRDRVRKCVTCNLAFAIAGALIAASAARAAVGDLYEADFASGNIFKFTPAGAKTTFATGLSSPAGLAFDSAGNLFITNDSGNSITRITPSGTKSTFATGLNLPYGLAFDPSGNLYEADEGSGSVFKFTAAGARSTFASGLSSPAGLAFDSSGNLFVGNFTAGRIDKITPTGTRTTFATGLSFPDGLNFNSSGNLLECDSGSGNVFSFTPAGVRTIFAGGFVQNSGVVADAAGNTYVTQNAAGNITKINSGGTRTIFATGLANPQYMALEPASSSVLGNISTRSFVQTGDNVMIGGFIIQGTAPKKVILRALGPELMPPPYDIPNFLADPTLGLYNGTGTLIASNNDWQKTIIGGIITHDQVEDIINSGLAPTDPSESAIVATLQPGNYTAIVSGVNGTVGVALVEAYDLSAAGTSVLGNISTRSFVQTGDNVMIGGFIIEGNQPKSVIVRAIGPELIPPPYNIPNALADPTLELHNSTGGVIASNNNWQTTIIGGIITHDQVQDIINSGHAPTQPSESAIIGTLQPGNYTAIVSGVNNTTGVALVEVYDLDQ